MSPLARGPSKLMTDAGMGFSGCESRNPKLNHLNIVFHQIEDVLDMVFSTCVGRQIWFVLHPLLLEDVVLDNGSRLSDIVIPVRDNSQ